MILVPLLMLLTPGLIAIRILWRGKTIARADYVSIAFDYIVYSFLILVVSYAFMFVTYTERTISFSTQLSEFASHIYSASFVFKYSFSALLSAVILPIALPWAINELLSLKSHLMKKIDDALMKKLIIITAMSFALLIVVFLVIVNVTRTVNDINDTAISADETEEQPELEFLDSYTESESERDSEVYYLEPEIELEIMFAGLVGKKLAYAEPFYDGDFVLSAPPGFHNEPFDLVVSIPSIPDAVIYYTIDGNEPHMEDDRFIQRGDNLIQVSGQIPETGLIGVHDRTSHWRHAILAHYSDQWIRQGDVTPVEDADLLQGTTFRFRGFVGGEPVTEIVTATYIIAPDASSRFANRPVVSITAPYEDFKYIYSHADWTDPAIRRRVFNYEYFDVEDRNYIQMFNLPGSTGLGGMGSRNYAQRTFNVHLSRGELGGVVTYPVFTDLDELYRFRLRNGGVNMQDAFTQAASSQLNVLYSDNKLVIMFINGEYWGFTTMREHTSNRQFVTSRTGLQSDNIAILSRTYTAMAGGVYHLFDEIAEGDEGIVQIIYNDLVDFVASNDMSADYARERLFNEYFCQENFMDYVIANTFFNNRDWPRNNLRFFRAISPESDTSNSYSDGKWRFIMHDMDEAPHRASNRRDSRFSNLYSLPDIAPDFNHIFLVFNNKTFVEQFVERANYILDNFYQTERLLDLHKEFVSSYNPLLSEMFNRFAIAGQAERSFADNINHTNYVSQFLLTRHHHYRAQLDHLLERLSEDFDSTQ